jgi:hypothetical protein
VDLECPVEFERKSQSVAFTSNEVEYYILGESESDILWDKAFSLTNNGETSGYFQLSSKWSRVSLILRR